MSTGAEAKIGSFVMFGSNVTLIPGDRITEYDRSIYGNGKFK